VDLAVSRDSNIPVTVFAESKVLCDIDL